MMWSYYGSKSKIAKFYPKPEYKLIIEPFAGAAWYSILHRHNNIILNEKNSTIYKLWEWLIKESTQDVILQHKDFYVGQDINCTNVDPSHKDLIGFCINRGSVTPKNIVQKWSCQVLTRPNWASTTAHSLIRVAKLLPEIRHWKYNFGDYEDLDNIEATWFIDPPYLYGGNHYPVSDINYEKLADWCRTRKGQVIVCENTKASWLPFTPLIEIQGQKNKTVEAIWTNSRR